MRILIEVGRERFDVEEVVQPDGACDYRFSWVNGPAGGAYGFVIGGGRLARASPERAAQGFVRSFFAPDGIGPSDFPAFVDARRAEQA